jgi:hypothetical protein
MINDCLCIVVLSFIVLMNHAAMLCSLCLLVDPLQVFPLYYKLWQRINFCTCVRNDHVFCMAEINDTELLFLCTPQHTYTLHLTED